MVHRMSVIIILIIVSGIVTTTKRLYTKIYSGREEQGGPPISCSWQTLLKTSADIVDFAGPMVAPASIIHEKAEYPRVRR